MSRSVTPKAPGMAAPTSRAGPTLGLAVQYGAAAPELSRSKLRRWVARAVEFAATQEAERLGQSRFHRVELTLRLVDHDEGLQLNQQYRGRDYATNVLTFEYGVDPEGTASGDIVICLPVLQREAKEQNKTFSAHAAHLVVHGVLHALGHDHIEDEQARDMEALETHILASLRMPDPYRETLVF